MSNRDLGGAPTGTTRWEYVIIEVTGRLQPEGDALLAGMNEAGADGWEVIAMTPTSKNPLAGTGKWNLWVKRPAGLIAVTQEMPDKVERPSLEMRG